MTRHADLSDAVTDALRAPSVHNTQPWRWRIRPAAVELYADEDRHLDVTDPDRRDLVLSCGAALHHLRVALAARGLATEVRRLPDPEDRTHLATVTVGAPGTGTPDAADASLFPAIAERHTERRRMSHREVAREHIESLQEHARAAGAVLVPVTDPHIREHLVAVLTDAAQQQGREPGYAAELRLWTHRLPGAHDGVPTDSVAAPPVGLVKATGLRRFGQATLAQPTLAPGHPPDDAAQLLVLATAGDDVLDRLCAGEATSAVLLAATRKGLATTPLSQALEIDASRRRMQTDVLGIPEQPQLVIRIGWPAADALDLSETPRRALRVVLLAD